MQYMSSQNKLDSLFETIYFSNTVLANVHNIKAIFKTFHLYFSPVFVCVLDLFCSTRTDGPSSQQRNSLCNASSEQI